MAINTFGLYFMKECKQTPVRVSSQSLVLREVSVGGGAISPISCRRKQAAVSSY